MNSGGLIEGRSSKCRKDAEAGRCRYDIPKKCCLKIAGNRYYILLIINNYAYRGSLLSSERILDGYHAHWFSSVLNVFFNCKCQ